MSRLRYDIGFAAGIALVGAGVWLNFGAGYALIAGGALFLGMLVFSVIARG